MASTALTTFRAFFSRGFFLFAAISCRNRLAGASISNSSDRKTLEHTNAKCRSLSLVLEKPAHFLKTDLLVWTKKLPQPEPTKPKGRRGTCGRLGSWPTPPGLHLAENCRSQQQARRKPCCWPRRSIPQACGSHSCDLIRLVAGGGHLKRDNDCVQRLKKSARLAERDCKLSHAEPCLGARLCSQQTGSGSTKASL